MSINIDTSLKNRILKKLKFLFGAGKDLTVYEGICDLIERFGFPEKKAEDSCWLDEKDVFLITYGDSIKSNKEPPLQTLSDFLRENVKGIIEYVHILPFYPYSSDDGFSVIDYFEVNPELGNWEDIKGMSGDFNLMFDAVINHISAKSRWFTEYLNGNPEYKDYFIEAEESPELKKVFRPRALPLLTKFKTSEGERLIWTTFSTDQIDLNYKSKTVFLKIIELLLFYAEMGAKAIRLDAIGFMWKELGTSCVHLPQTHAAIQLFKDVFDAAASETLIITETNVPHKENISYFGDGTNEAQLVYQFPLPPLVLYSMISGNAAYLSKWADSLELISERTTFFNFLASHDGIGVVPTHGILSDKQREVMIQRVYDNGGHVSFKTREDGTEIPYELNINYFDAVRFNDVSEEENIRRFICAQSILLSIIGVPAIYIHSLLGSKNYHQGVKETGRYRSINREKLFKDSLNAELSDPGSGRAKVFKAFTDMIKVRRDEKAFHPNSPQKILFPDDKVFAMVRGDDANIENKILVLNNVSPETAKIKIDLIQAQLKNTDYKDLLGDSILGEKENIIDVVLKPYQVMWLKPALCI